MHKLAIVTTHPIQYNAPWFKLLAQQPNLQVKVFYTWSQAVTNSKYDPDFGKVISWDIPLLEGYDYEFIKNIAKDPGSHHFKGINNPTLIDKIAAWGPASILVIGWSYNSHLSCMRHFKGKVQVLFRGDSTLLDERPGFRKLVRRLFLTYVYSFIDIAFYVGTNNKQYFLKHGLKERQLRFATHAIDNNRFYNNEYNEKERYWKQELGIPADAFVLLFAGKLEPKKDPFFMVKLANELNDKNVYTIFVGNGILENSLKEQTKQNKRILFLDFQNQQMMPSVYRLADVYILPSQGPGETWGLALNEAMASGRAVMASNKVGGALDLIQPYKNGFIFNSGDVTAATAFLNKIIDNKELVEQMGKQSKQLIQSFSFKNLVNSISGLINESFPDTEKKVLNVTISNN